MSREEAYQVTLEAIAKMQWNVALILEAKAIEAEKVRNWLCTHIANGTYPDHSDQLSTSLQFNEQNIEVIEGLTKLCNGLSRNMKVIINPDNNDSDSMASMFGGMGSGDQD
ncbi:restriction endonuclease subunit S [Cohnella sp. WQ 127256]|uniref:restriction endonuclease subunit S n=1 Tax=Cohnella sp. WQ 127256 TaxID=2938790 RepID=UPI002117FFF0|nr:restriction endonuclease subunit S [Cohnella sp. WQ 127256]